MSKQAALNIVAEITKCVKKFRLIQEPTSLLDKKIWFCRLWYAPLGMNLNEHKKLLQRLMDGEVIKHYGNQVTYCLGYGKYLGLVNYHYNNAQYVIYDTVITEGECQPRVCAIYSDEWFKLGLWAGKKFGKERVVFT